MGFACGRAVAALALAAGLGATGVASAHGAPAQHAFHQPAAGGAVGTGHLSRSDFSSRAKFRAAYLTDLRSRLAGGLILGNFTSPSGDVFALPDVDGDGRNDLADVRFTDGAQIGRVTGRSGRTAAPLWQVSMPDVVGATTAKGPGGAPALLTFSVSYTGQDAVLAGADTMTLTLTELDPKTGKSLWATTMHGLEGSDPVEGHYVVPYFNGLLAQRSGAAAILVNTSSFEWTPATFTSSAQATVISGDDGTTMSAGIPQVTDDYAEAVSVGDLDADGLSDFLTVSGGSLSVVSATSARTARPLWATPLANGSYLIQAVGTRDLDGDGMPDVVIVTIDPSGTPSVNALSGAKGTSLWSYRSSGALPLGLTGHHGGPAVLTAGQGATQKSFELNALDSAGHVLWRQELPSEHYSYFFPMRVGDVDGDHVDDLAIRGHFESKSGGRADPGGKTFVYSGANGRLLATIPLAFPAYVPFNARGDDLYSVNTSTGRVDAIGYDGATGKRLFRANMALKGADSWYGYDVGRFASTRRNDLLLTAYGSHDAYVILVNTATGKPVWTLHSPL